MESTKYLEVTPEVATAWLKKNVVNRTYRHWHAQNLANKILQGEWQTTHQGVAFDTDGFLLDGQHRLSAIAIAGKPVRIAVSKNVDRAAFKAIDNGLKRTITDLTNVPMRAAEASRFAIELFYRRNSASPEEVIAIHSSDFGKAHALVMETCSTSAKVFSSAFMRTAAVYLMLSGVDADEVLSNYKHLVLGDYALLSPICVSFTKQANQGQINSREKAFNFARGLKVLDPKNSHLSKLSIGATEVEHALELLCTQTEILLRDSK